MQDFYQEHAGGFRIVEPKEIWKLYTEQGYQMDSNYRQFHLHFGNTLKDSNAVVEDKLKHAAEYVESLYKNWFLAGLTSCWTNAVYDDLASLGYVSEIHRQRDFYAHYVRPLAGKTTRAFVIISDALRYEVAAELSRDAGSLHQGNRLSWNPCRRFSPPLPSSVWPRCFLPSGWV